MTLSALHADIAARYARLNQSIAKGAIKPAQAAALGERYAYPVSKDALGIARAGAAQAGGIDATDHSVSFIISTQEEDRDGDIVVSRGGDLGAYSRNPIVLFGHGSWQIPIGTAKGPDGQLCVWCEEHRVRAKCFFDMPDPDAAFIYGKVERGILNATSISFLPTVAHKREYEKSHSEGSKPLGWIFERWELTEFSIVAIPANAGAIRDSLDSEKSFMSPKLQKALSPFAAAAKGRCFSGYCPCPPCEDKAFNEADHPRGQPDNAGQFGPASGLPEESSAKPSLREAKLDYKKNGTKAKAFKAWFGDWENDPQNASKVVDDNGPEKNSSLEVFHGTHANVDQFSYRHAGEGGGAHFGEGFYFTPNEDYAAHFAGEGFGEGEGKILKVYLNIRNPYVITDNKEYRDLVREYGDADALNKDLRSQGYDGLRIDRYEAAISQDVTEWVAFEPTQIKAVDNVGTFDPNNPKIKKNLSFLGEFLQAQKVKDMSTKLNAATLTSGLPGAKKCHKSTCKCKKCKKALPERENATPGSEAAGVHEERNEGQEHEAEERKGELQAGVDAKMPKLIECGYTEPQAMCLAAHLHGKGLEGDDITGHEEAAKALGYKSKDDMGGDSGGEESMSLKSFVKAMKEEDEEDSAKTAAATEEKPAEGETEETENGEADEQYKPSQKMLGHMHNHMKNAHDYLSKELPLMDHEKIAKALTAHCKDLEGHMQNYKELASTNHGMSSGAFDKMCKSLEGGETETEENETGANSEQEATGAEDHGSTEESGQDLIREYQHPKGVGSETMKSLAGTLGRIKGFTDQKSEEWFRISGQRI